MSNWLSKSESSLAAAESLLDVYSNQSIHCSYYSCVQFIYHLMISNMGVPEDNLENGTAKKEYENSLPKNSGKSPRLTTHVWLHHELRRSLLSRHTDPNVVEDIMEDVSVIAGVRVSADYKKEIILEPRARGIHEKATNLIKTLENIY